MGQRAAPRIRPFERRRDLESFKALNALTFYNAIPHEDRPTMAAFLKHYPSILANYLLDDPAKCRVTVAEMPDGTYAGHCWLISQSDFFTGAPLPWILDISVVASCQRTGAGTALMQEVAAFVKGLGMDRVGLQVAAVNEDALAFYRRLGFSVRTLTLELAC